MIFEKSKVTYNQTAKSLKTRCELCFQEAALKEMKLQAAVKENRLRQM